MTQIHWKQRLAALTSLTLLIGLAGCHEETGAEISNRIAAACADEYGAQGDQAVTECRMRQTIKAMDRMGQDRERSVDARVGN